MRKKKPQGEKKIPIKIKRAFPEKSFWQESDFEEGKLEKELEEKPRKPRKATAKEKIRKQPKKPRKKNRTKYFLLGFLLFTLLAFVYLFFITRPSLAKKYEQKADLKIQSGETTYALQDYQKALTLTPHNSSLYSKIAKIYQEKDLRKPTKGYAKRAIELNPQNSKAYLILGQVEFLEKDYDQADENLKKALEQNEDNLDVYMDLVKVLIARNKKEEAETLAQKSFLLYPEESEIIYNRSLVWFWEKDYQKAKEGLEKLNKYGGRDLVKDSKLALETISKINSPISEPYKETILGNFYNQIDLPSQSVIYFNQALKANSSYRDAYLGLGEAYLLEKKYQEAEKQFKKALKEDSVYGLTFYFLGRVCEEQKISERALELFKKAIERGYDNENIRKDMAEIYLDQENYQEALTIYQKALNFSKNDLEIYQKIVWLQGEKLNQPENALKKAKEIEGIEPKTALSYNILAEVYLYNNQLDLARQNIDKAILVDSSFALTYYNLALIFQREKNLKEAKKYFIKAADYDTSGNIFNQAYNQLKAL
jgi:tetratricopeptide (TPR) repeat protein